MTAPAFTATSRQGVLVCAVGPVERFYYPGRQSSDCMREISTENAPVSIGPYSQAIEANGFLFVSGQGAAEPETREVVSDDIREQTQQVFDNISAILEAAGASLDDVVKANVYLTDMDTYEAVNEVYADNMNEPFPARAAVEVSDLPIDIGVEIEVVAVAPSE